MDRHSLSLVQWLEINGMDPGHSGGGGTHSTFKPRLVAFSMDPSLPFSSVSVLFLYTNARKKGKPGKDARPGTRRSVARAACS